MFMFCTSPWSSAKVSYKSMESVGSHRAGESGVLVQPNLFNLKVILSCLFSNVFTFLQGQVCAKLQTSAWAGLVLVDHTHTSMLITNTSAHCVGWAPVLNCRTVCSWQLNIRKSLTNMFTFWKLNQVSSKGVDGSGGQSRE